MKNDEHDQGSSDFIKENINDLALKKCKTSAEDKVHITPQEVKKDRRRNTCINFKIKEQNLVRIMSENIYSGQLMKLKVDQIDSENSESEDSDSEGIVTCNWKYSLKALNIKKVGRMLNENTYLAYDSESQMQINIDSSLTKVEETTMTNSIEVDQMPNNNQNKAQSSIFEILMGKYYCGLSENYNSNFERYVVNNLTIISYLEKKMQSEMQNVLLTKESMEALNLFDRSKKILFLDLDETLVHTDITQEYENYDIEINIPVEDGEYTVNVFIRPFTFEFLKFAKERFNIVLYTAGMKEYVDPIIKCIDPLEEFFQLRLYRDSCIELKNFFIKDLGILATFELKDMIILDNCIFSFALNLKNGILISSFYNDKQDSELLNVMDYIDSRIVDANDVRVANESYYGFDTIKNSLFEMLEKEGIA